MASKPKAQTNLNFAWVHETSLDLALRCLPSDFLIEVGRTEIRRAVLRWQGMSQVDRLVRAETELSLANGKTPKRKKVKKKK